MFNKMNPKLLNILYNNFNNYPYNLNKNEINQKEINPNNINNINYNNEMKLNPSEYIFEKYGKRGWLCENCNNFNFASRIKCNKCGQILEYKESLNGKDSNKSL